MMQISSLSPLPQPSSLQVAKMICLLILLTLASAWNTMTSPGHDLPVVDLGYELHQAISFDVKLSELQRIVSDLTSVLCPE